MLYAGTVVAAGTGRGVAVATGSATELGRISALLDAVDPLADAADARARPPRARRSRRSIGVAAVLLGRRRRGARLPARRRRPGRHQPRRRRGPRGAARGGHDRAGDRRAADGAPAGDHPPPAGGRDARHDDRRRLGQDRHADPQPDDACRRRGRREPATTCASCCSRACCATTPRPRVATAKASGDPTETALLEYAASRGIDVEPRGRSTRASTPCPFDAERKLMATLHAARGGGTAVYVKGAPEAVLPLCADGATPARRTGRAAGRRRASACSCSPPGDGEATSLDEPSAACACWVCRP